MAKYKYSAKPKFNGIVKWGYTYTVWVGGGEVNSHYINEKEEAKDIARFWANKGYKDVVLERVELPFGR